jgi:AcrR family transcriptional regulator
MKPDRRIERTRKLIRDALYELIIEKGYDAISVQQIIDRANVARSSFYAHFRDKDDLLLHGFSADVETTLSGNLFETAIEPGNYPQFGHALFKSAATHKTMVRALFSMDANSLTTKHLRNLLVVQTREWLQQHCDANRPRREIELAVQYLSNALIGLLVWWVHNDFPYSIDEMNEAFNTLSQTGLNGLLPLAPS